MARSNSRDKILKHAMEEFEYYGYSGTSCDQIAQKAGVSKTLIFKYYDSKENVLKHCIKMIVDDFMSECAAFLDRKEADLEDALDFSFELIRRHKSRWRFVVSTITTPALREYCEEIASLVQSRVKDIICKCCADGQMDADDLTELSHLAISNYLSWLINENEEGFRMCNRLLLERYRSTYAKTK